MGQDRVVRVTSGSGRRGALLGLAGAVLSAASCAGPTSDGASPTSAAFPAGALPLASAALGSAALHAVGEGGETGGLLGTAVCVAPGLVACAAHSLPPGARSVVLRAAHLGGPREVAVLGRGSASDVAFLADAGHALTPVLSRAERPLAGAPVWAAGNPVFGPATASGAVEHPDAVLPGFGRGFTARLPALMGYSGGPVVDEDGRLRGLVSALPEPGGAGALALLAGFDLAGLARGRPAPRRVFALSMDTVLGEARALGLA